MVSHSGQGDLIVSDSRITLILTGGTLWSVIVG